jgi:hypothetical protein
MLVYRFFIVSFPYKFFQRTLSYIFSPYVAIFPYEFGISAVTDRQALTHVCVLMPNRASNIGHFANGVMFGYPNT